MRVTRQLRTAASFAGIIARAAAHYWGSSRKRNLTVHDRAEWLSRWSRAVLKALRVELETAGAFADRGLVVANHLSYLDVLVLAAIAPCTFVSKREVRSWPVVGLLTRMAGTIYVDRKSRRDASRVASAVEERLRAGQVVVVFPEGTSSDGNSVLPFRPSLFQASIDAGEQVTPVHLSYSASEANPATDVCYWGAMTFFFHVWNLFGIPRIQAAVKLGESRQYNDRKVAAAESHLSVSELSCAS